MISLILKEIGYHNRNLIVLKLFAALQNGAIITKYKMCTQLQKLFTNLGKEKK